MKAFECNKINHGCNAVIRGKDNREVMAKATEHAKRAHGMDTIPADMAKKVEASIHDE